MGSDPATGVQAVHTLIIGAGPGGLAAAYHLSGAGVPVVVLDKEATAGGLMRSIRRGAFIVDIGRKELYNRIPQVDALWRELLGDDYRAYSHRFGTLYEGHIIESSSGPRGMRRGMPWRMFVVCALDRVWCQVRYRVVKPRTYEEYMYGTSGRRFSRILGQVFWEKFNAQRWATMPPPAPPVMRVSSRPLFITGQSGTAKLASGGSGQQAIWRHPARGTGQIVELLEQHVRARGGVFHCEARVTNMSADETGVATVTVASEESTVIYRPRHIVSSLPLEYLAGMLLPQSDLAPELGETVYPVNPTPEGRPQRSTVLVYLFLDEPPRFPHAWLEVTDPRMRAGRITNYAAFNGKMVPPGKTALCLEFFCAGPDPLVDLSPEDLFRLGLSECAGARLIDPTRCVDHLVLKLPGADAAVSVGAWQGGRRSFLTRALRRFRNLYDVNQPGTDHATYAGLEAAESILSGDRERFDEVSDIDLKFAASPYYQSRSGMIGVKESRVTAGLKRVGAPRPRDGRTSRILRVLLYHRICDPTRRYYGDPRLISATPADFESQIRYVATRYTPVSGEQVVAALTGEASLPDKAVLVTFDDGYHDFLTHAWPILKRHQVPAVMFIVTGCAAHGRFWWDALYEMIKSTPSTVASLSGSPVISLRTPRDRHLVARRLIDSLKRRSKGIPLEQLEQLGSILGWPEAGEALVLTWDELRMLCADGLTVASHGRTHASLPFMLLPDALDEVVSAHEELTQAVGKPAQFFAYPYGFADFRIVPTLQSLGYVAAFGAVPGINSLGHRDSFYLCRHAVNHQHSAVKFLLSFTRGYAQAREYKRKLFAYFN